MITVAWSPSSYIWRSPISAELEESEIIGFEVGEILNARFGNTSLTAGTRWSRIIFLSRLNNLECCVKSCKRANRESVTEGIVIVSALASPVERPGGSSGLASFRFLYARRKFA